MENNSKVSTFRHHIKSFSPSIHSGKLFVLCVFASLGTLVLYLQGYHIGFEPGHHGWVSAHTLAQLIKANYENFFVGYTLKYFSNHPWHEYYYFDRYPVPFSVAFNSILKLLNGSMGETVYYARQVMNVIFLAMIYLTYCLLLQLSNNRIASLCASISVFSGYYFVFYKDMIHYDQPAVVGLLLATNAIVFYYKTGKRWPILLAAGFCVSFGRGYSSSVFILFWFSCSILIDLVNNSFSLKRAVASQMRKPMLPASIIAIFISTLFLCYNIYIETKVRQVTIEETSIVRSALTRTGLDDEFNKKFVTELSWRNVSELNLQRLYESLFPAPLKNSTLLQDSRIQSIMLLTILLFALRYSLTLSKELRTGYFFTFFGAFSWTMLMRNLTVFHDYTSMYYCALLGAIFIAIYSFIPNRVLNWLVLPVLLFGFYSSIQYANDLHMQYSPKSNLITNDFEIINTKLPTNSHVYVDGGYRKIVEGVPYSMGYYGSNYLIAGLPAADYIISSKPVDIGWNLTPKNSLIFLYKIERPYRS